MSISRSSLYTILQRDFKNSKQRKLIIDSTKNILEHHPELATRIFDKFPRLLPQNKLIELTNQFYDIFMQVDDTSISGTELEYKADKKRISDWEKKIANIAIAELLNNEGTIKDELVELLEWQNFQKQFNSPTLVCSIVCAYVGAVNQDVMHNLSKHLSNRSTIYLAVCSYINKNNRAWVNHQIYEFKQRFSGLKETPYKSDKWYIEKTLVLGAVAAATILFFKNINLGNNNGPTEEKKLKVSGS